jgi:hypothetical protein
MSMKRAARAFGPAAVLVGLLLAVGAAFAEGPVHIRGTLTAVSGHELTVKTSRGATVTLTTDDKTGVFLVTKADLSAIKEGKFVGVTSVEEDGKTVAREVHVFADSLRGLAEGHYPWDLESTANMMTNANVAKVEAVGGGNVLKLNYPGGEQTIVVPPTATVVAFDPAKPDALVVGRQVFVLPGKVEGGPIAAIVVGAEGVKPPM